MYRLLLLGCTCFYLSATLTGCASRTAPAPLVLLDSQPTEETGGYTSPTYTVRQGDTLFAIAWYTGNDYRDIAKFNQLSEPFTIYPGQTLRLTPSAIAASKTQPVSSTATPSVPTSPISRPAPRPISIPPAPTSDLVIKTPIDPSPTQRYGESENNVNKNKNKCDKNSTLGVNNPSGNGFPKRVACWTWPADGKLIATFDESESGNKGVDIAGARGSDVVAAAEGKVVYSGSALRGYGNLVIIKHTDSFLSAYAYNQNIVVKERDWVYAGQKIATMGDSGTDSVKLHFEVRYRGKSLDPLKYLPKQQ